MHGEHHVRLAGVGWINFQLWKDPGICIGHHVFLVAVFMGL